MAFPVESYDTNDNDLCLFRVQINRVEKVAKVYDISVEDSDDNSEKDKLIHTFVFADVWVGEGQPLLGCEDLDVCEIFGNTILLGINPEEKVNSLRYIFIGRDIFEFTTEDPIVAFDSPVGRSNVAYPCATDEKGHKYLLSHKIISTNPKGNPYMHYYGIENEEDGDDFNHRELYLWTDNNHGKHITIKNSTNTIFLKKTLEGMYPLYHDVGPHFWGKEDESDVPYADRKIENLEEVITLLAKLNKRLGFEPMQVKILTA